MIIFYCFRVQAGRGFKDSPLMGSGDMVRLEKLFPDSPVWKGQAGGVGNIRTINVDESRALYEAMVKHYAENGVSDEQYQTNAIGPFAVGSDLQSVFDELIEFFEKTFNLTSSEEAKKAITARQQERRQREEQARARYRENALTLFEKLGTLKPPADAVIRSQLEGKLDEYRKRLDQWEFQHPDLAFRVQPGFRDATFKILVAETVLNATGEVNLLDLFKTQLEKYGDLLDAHEFFTACGVISAYLGTPLLNGHIGEPVTA